MTDDRELLELAAKAAGMNVSWDHYDPDYCAGAEGMFLNGERSPDNSKYWNPLTNDGDALRLAVKLGIEYGFGYSDGLIVIVIVVLVKTQTSSSPDKATTTTPVSS